METSKHRRQELEHRVHVLSGEGGARAIRELLVEERDGLNQDWPTLVGDELLQAQGAAKILGKVLRAIDDGPKIPVKAERSAT